MSYIQENIVEQPRHILVIEVLKNCDVLVLGFVKAGKDKGEDNGT